jgi:hypothetical protein
VIQLILLNGRKAGCDCVARRFPFQLGRASDSHLALEGDGVWERHAAITFRPREGFFVEVQGKALLSVNGQSVQRTRLRNGDLIECGSAKLRFWLAPVRQRSLAPREILTWVALAALLVFQLGLIYRLLG